jgi:hypothetical protein
MAVSGWNGLMKTVKCVVSDRQGLIGHLRARAKSRLSFEELGEAAL